VIEYNSYVSVNVLRMVIFRCCKAANKILARRVSFSVPLILAPVVLVFTLQVIVSEVITSTLY